MSFLKTFPFRRRKETRGADGHRAVGLEAVPQTRSSQEVRLCCAGDRNLCVLQAVRDNSWFVRVGWESSDQSKVRLVKCDSGVE
jgi:hypothetical protein